jgi:hypothetical protein
MYVTTDLNILLQCPITGPYKLTKFQTDTNILTLSKVAVTHVLSHEQFPYSNGLILDHGLKYRVFHSFSRTF